MSDVGSDRCWNTQGFLTKNVKELFWDLNFLSEVTGCRETQVSERTGSTVIITQKIKMLKIGLFYINITKAILVFRSVPNTHD